MTQTMSKRERIQATLKGEEVDVIPISFWYHFGTQERSANYFAGCELEFYRRYLPDFLKVMHDYPYDLPSGMERMVDARDWERFQPLVPTQGGFGRQLEALQIIVRELRGEEVPIIDTIFSPFATALRTVGDVVYGQMEEAPDLLKGGLSVIAESLARFSQACLEVGLEGIYFAANGCSYDQMTESQYREFALPYDLQVLEAVKEGSFNVVHIHGTSNLMFRLLASYPAHALCWSSRLTEPSLAQARALGDWCLIGGINEDPPAILSKTPAEMMAEVEDAIAQAGERKFMVGPGCAIPTETPEELLEAALATVRKRR